MEIGPRAAGWPERGNRVGGGLAGAMARGTVRGDVSGGGGVPAAGVMLCGWGAIARSVTGGNGPVCPSSTMTGRKGSGGAAGRGGAAGWGRGGAVGTSRNGPRVVGGCRVEGPASGRAAGGSATGSGMLAWSGLLALAVQPAWEPLTAPTAFSVGGRTPAAVAEIGRAHV